MSAISACPLCSRMVSIPEGLDLAALVRCPLCGGEYPLEASLKLIPPELIPVETSVAKPDHESGISPGVAGEDSIIAAPPIASSFLSDYAEDAGVEDGPNMIYALADREEIAETSDSALDAEVCNLIAKHKEEIKEELSSQTEAAGPCNRLRRKPKSAARIFMEIVIGGAVGLAIAYIALAWILGSRFDLPAPPRILKPVLRFVLPDRVWTENQEPIRNRPEA
jgi:hypothetical protein